MSVSSTPVNNKVSASAVIELSQISRASSPIGISSSSSSISSSAEAKAPEEKKVSFGRRSLNVLSLPFYFAGAVLKFILYSSKWVIFSLFLSRERYFQKVVKENDIALKEKVNLWNKKSDKFSYDSFIALLLCMKASKNEEIVESISNIRIDRGKVFYVLKNIDHFYKLTAKEMMQFVSHLLSKLSLDDQIVGLLSTSVPVANKRATIAQVDAGFLKIIRDLLEKVDAGKKIVLLHGMEEVINDEALEDLIYKYLDEKTVEKIYLYAGRLAYTNLSKCGRIVETLIHWKNNDAYYCELGKSCDVEFLRQALHLVISQDALIVRNKM